MAPGIAIRASLDRHSFECLEIMSMFITASVPSAIRLYLSDSDADTRLVVAMSRLSSVLTADFHDIVVGAAGGWHAALFEPD